MSRNQPPGCELVLEQDRRSDRNALPRHCSGHAPFDPKTHSWSSWWLDDRDPRTIAAPLRGTFAGGIGTFLGAETLQGRPIQTRVLWSHITARSARWEQAACADGGKAREVNWVSDFSRA